MNRDTNNQTHHRYGRAYLALFTTGFVQVFFVVANTYFVAKLFYFGIATASFLISWIWTYNIRRIAAGTITERIVYSTGAMCGSLLSVFISKLII
jgi:hypothetical protein